MAIIPMALSKYWYTLYIFLLVPHLVLGQQGTTGTNRALENSERKPLYIIGMFPMSGAWPGGAALLPAMQMAVDDINNKSDVLPEYKMYMNWYDTKCDSGVGIKELYHQLYTPPAKIALVAPGCSEVAQPVSKSLHLWNVVQVGGVVSPDLSNKAKYPNFLRVQSPESLMNPAKIAIMKRYNWKRVATVHEPIPLFSKDIDDLRLRLAAENMTLISSHIISENPELQVQSLKQDNARIIVISCFELRMAAIICEAYKAGMYGRRYVYLMADWYSPNWPEHSHSHTDCTPEQLYAVMRSSSIAFTYQPVTNNKRQTRGVAAMNPPEFMKRYLVRTDNNLYSGADEAGINYDAVWAIALGLNKTVVDLKSSGKGLDDFSYTDKAMADLILHNIWGQEFLGISGDVFFDENGDTPRDVQVTQYRGTKKHVVGLYVQSQDFVKMYDDIGLSWDGGVPKDATTFKTVHVFVSGTVYVSVCCCAGVGIVVALAFLVFNIYFRKLRIIKMSSPIMNNVILLGCIVVYLTVFLQELSADNVALLCQLRTVTIMVGFSLSFGALFAKTWRVYVIFTNTTKRVVLHDYQLLLILTVLVLIDLTAFFLREALDTPSVVNTVLEKEVLDNGDLVVEKELLSCQSDYSLYFEASVMVYKGLLLIFGAFLAFQTRKVNIPALNDSQYIGMCVYNVTILSILGVVLVFALQNQVVLSYTLVSAFIIFATTIVQLTIFIPKVLKVYNASNRIEGDDSTTEAASTSAVLTQKPGTTVTTVDNMTELEATKKQLREAREGQQELKLELEATKKQLEEALMGQQALKQIVEATNKELQQAQDGLKGGAQSSQNCIQ